MFSRVPLRFKLGAGPRENGSNATRRDKNPGDNNNLLSLIFLFELANYFSTRKAGNDFEEYI